MRGPHRLAQQGQHAVGGAQGCGPVVVMLGQGAQRLEELRRQQQHEQAAEQGELLGRAELDVAQQAEADVDGHHGDGHRSEEFEHRRGEKGHPQGAHAESAILICRRVHLGSGLARTAEELQRGDAAHAVEKVPREPAHGNELVAIEALRPHAHQGHEQRNQRCSEQQEQCRQPVERHHHHQDQQRNGHAQPQLGQKAGEVAVQRLDLLDQLVGQPRRMTGAGANRPHRGEVVEQLGAHRVANAQAGQLTAQLLPPLAQGAGHQHRHQQQEGRGERGQRRAIHQQAADDPRQQCHLGDGQRTGGDTRQRGQHQPAALAGRMSGQPASRRRVSVALHQLSDSPRRPAPCRGIPSRTRRCSPARRAARTARRAAGTAAIRVPRRRPRWCSWAAPARATC